MQHQLLTDPSSVQTKTTNFCFTQSTWHLLKSNQLISLIYDVWWRFTKYNKTTTIAFSISNSIPVHFHCPYGMHVLLLLKVSAQQSREKNTSLWFGSCLASCCICTFVVIQYEIRIHEHDDKPICCSAAATPKNSSIVIESFALEIVFMVIVMYIYQWVLIIKK